MLNTVNNYIKSSILPKWDNSSVKTSLFITNALDVLQQAEQESTIYEMNYTQQKAINSTPSLLSTGLNLQTYSLPIKLHYSFCDPQKIIDEIQERIQSCQPFLYFQGDKFINRFVINKLEKSTVSRIGGTIICAEIKIDLLEAPFEEGEEFVQQNKVLKTPSGKLQTLREKLKVPAKLKRFLEQIPDAIKVNGLGYLDEKSKGLASEALKSDSLLDLALRNTQSYLNLKTNGISEEILNSKGEFDDLVNGL